jgi:heme exporter protein B
MMRSILHIIKLEAKIEWRQKSTIFGILLYLFTIVLLTYSMHSEPDSKTWNSFLWLTSLFVIMNTVAKSFIGQHRQEWNYHYTIFHPSIYVIGKMIYSAMITILIASLSLLLFGIFFKFPIQDGARFVLFYLLGSLSLSLLFTFLSAIVAKVNNNPTLLAIIGLPLMITYIILLSDMSMSFYDLLLVKGWNKYFFSLLGLDLIVIMLALGLYPFIWKE